MKHYLYRFVPYQYIRQAFYPIPPKQIPSVSHQCTSNVLLSQLEERLQHLHEGKQSEFGFELELRSSCIPDAGKY